MELCENLLCQHNALRRLGFSRDDIYVCPNIVWSGSVCWGTSLKVDGKEWRGAVAPCTKPHAVFQKRWQRYIEVDVQVLSEDELLAIWLKHMPLDLFRSLVESIAVKGIDIPTLPLAEMLRGSPGELQKALAEVWN